MRWKDDFSYFELIDNSRDNDEAATRPVIERGSHVSGAALLKRGGSETIVVDTESNASIYEDLFDDVLTLASKAPYGKSGEEGQLQAVFDVVQAKIVPYEDHDRTIAEAVGCERGGEVALSVFVEAGTGQCRHMTLTVAALIEMLTDRGYLKGKSSYETNRRISTTDPDDHESHSWVRYETEDGETFVIDAALDFLGSLEDSVKYATWNYTRTEEVGDYRKVMSDYDAQLTQRLLGKKSVASLDNSSDIW